MLAVKSKTKNLSVQFHCCLGPALVSTAMPEPDFHNNLSNIMNNNYWTKKDYIKYNDARRSLKEKVKQVDMDIDKTPGVSPPVEFDGTLKATGDFVLGPVRPPSMSQEIPKNVVDPAPKLIKKNTKMIF